MAIGFPVKDDYATGDILTAANMNDLAGTVNTVSGAFNAAGKNKIINGDFSINQRAFTTSNTDGGYGFDKWRMNLSGATGTYTAETFTPGSAPVAGYEGKNYAKIAVTTGNDFCGLLQRIEDVRTFANQTITVSFWAKGINPTTNNGLYVWLIQSFGSGGSPSANVATESSKITLSASWTRYSVTINVPSIAGKTFGTTDSSGYLQVSVGQATNASTDAWTLEIWGVQAEAGSVATAFQTATGTIQGELAACQRYFVAITGDGTPNGAAPITTFGIATSTTDAKCVLPLPVTMRTAPSLSFSSVTDFRVYDGTNAAEVTTNMALSSAASQQNAVLIRATVASGLTQYRPYYIIPAALTVASIYASAEL